MEKRECIVCECNHDIDLMNKVEIKWNKNSISTDWFCEGCLYIVNPKEFYSFLKSNQIEQAVIKFNQLKTAIIK